ncbi:MAG: hypothetical protein WAK26_14245, partial [Terracidiphilus sp.]
MKKAFGAFWIFYTAFAMLILAIAFQPAAASGEDLIQLYKLAIDKDPQYKGASFERLAQKEGLKQALDAFWPNADFQGNMTETRQRVVDSENQVFANGSSTYMST